MKDHGAPVLVLELLEQREALEPHLLRARRIAPDVRRAAPGSEGVRAHGGAGALGRRALEGTSEPAHALARVVRDPELLERRRELERTLDLAVSQRPGERSAEVVLLC